MNAVTTFGIVSMMLMLAGFLLEHRNHWFTLAFAAGCAMTSAYAFLASVWIIGVIAFGWYLVTMRRWVIRAEADVEAS